MCRVNVVGQASISRVSQVSDRLQQGYTSSVFQVRHIILCFLYHIHCLEIWFLAHFNLKNISNASMRVYILPDFYLSLNLWPYLAIADTNLFCRASFFASSKINRFYLYLCQPAENRCSN